MKKIFEDNPLVFEDDATQVLLKDALEGRSSSWPANSAQPVSEGWTEEKKKQYLDLILPTDGPTKD